MKFLRRSWRMYSKLGKRRKSKQVWRKPKGRDNKMREKRKGRSPVVSIGYKTKRGERKVIVVNTLKDLEMAKKYEVVHMGRVGKKKKLEILKKAKENKINFSNFNAGRFLKKNEPRKKEKTS